VKNRVFLANEKRVHLLQKKYVGVQPFITEKKQNKTENKSKDAPKKRIVHEAIKI
jgi:hypothetical protein